MNNQDIRWVQRFANFAKAFDQLDEATQLRATRPLSKLESHRLSSLETAYALGD